MPVMHELHSNLQADLGAAPAVITDNTPMVSKIFDMQGFRSIEFYIQTGTLADADATFAVAVTHGDAVDSVSAPTSITDSGAAASERLLGTLVTDGFTFAADNTVKRVGYSPDKGAGKRWVRCTVTPSGNSGNAPLAILAVRLPLRVPVS